MDRARRLEESWRRAQRDDFDVQTLRLRCLRALLAYLFANPPPWAYRLLRRFLPAVKIFGWRYLSIQPSPKRGRVLQFLRRCLADLPLPVWRGWVLLTRDDDVREVLAKDKVFTVPWGDDVCLLNDGELPGTPFILGLDTRDPIEASLYREGLHDVMRSFRRDDVARLVVPRAAAHARAIVEGAAGRPLDAIQTLFVDVFIDTCEQYLGVPVRPDQRGAFYQWTVAVSGLLFGPPFERERALDTAKAGAARIALVIDIAIDATIRYLESEPADAHPDNVMVRLAKRHIADERDMSWLTMRAIMMGMVTGSVPTNAVAAGHILEVLLSQPDAMEQARAAAAGGDDDQLARCLFEAMRFWPLNPGPWRRCHDSYVLARGTRRERTIRPGTLILASTQSAMLDPHSVRRPLHFDPARDPADSLLFGHARHWCVGKYIAQAQITQAFKPLLLRGPVRRAPGADGRMRRLGLFPEHLLVV
ncbi:cytochrome P450 [Variovorax sp. LARHSF232]